MLILGSETKILSSPWLLPLSHSLISSPIKSLLDLLILCFLTFSYFLILDPSVLFSGWFLKSLILFHLCQAYFLPAYFVISMTRSCHVSFIFNSFFYNISLIILNILIVSLNLMFNFCGLFCLLTFTHGEWSSWMFCQVWMANFRFLSIGSLA